MNTPPEYVIERARITAINSPCAKSKRGAVVFSPEQADRFEQASGIASFTIEDRERCVIVSRGYNGQPPGFVCTGTPGCRENCGQLCLHAEQRAIHQAGCLLDQMDELELVHVKVVDGKVVPGPGPSCWQCSRLVVEVGLGGVWLYELAAIRRCEPCDFECDGTWPKSTCPNCARDLTMGQWRFYRAAEFHRATLNACAMPSNADCEHERLSDDKTSCLDCAMEFVACRGCYVIGSGVPVYHGIPECPITDEEWAEVQRKERDWQ